MSLFRTKSVNALSLLIACSEGDLWRYSATQGWETCLDHHSQDAWDVIGHAGALACGSACHVHSPWRPSCSTAAGLSRSGDREPSEVGMTGRVDQGPEAWMGLGPTPR